jgi:uncharacterized protein (DUF1697 family)
MLAIFLGSINVGGNRVAMADLCAAMAQAGHAPVSSVIASGNLLLPTHDQIDPASIEALIKDRFGITTVAIPRSLDAITTTLATNPFASGDPARVHIHWLERDVAPDRFAQLQADHAGRGSERLAIAPGALYIDFVDGVADSKLTAAFIERRLGCRGTARNLRSLTRIRDRMLQLG